MSGYEMYHNCLRELLKMDNENSDVFARILQLLCNLSFNYSPFDRGMKYQELYDYVWKHYEYAEDEIHYKIPIEVANFLMYTEEYARQI